MASLIETERIEILMMVGYGDRSRIFRNNGRQIRSGWQLHKPIESTFCLNGHTNRNNYSCWSNTNPHWMEEVQTQYVQKINVWRVIIGRPL